MIEIIPYIILAIEDDGDREFMAWLYIQYQSLLYSEIIRIVQSSTDAEDVLHTVIEKLTDKVGFLRKLDRRGLVNYIITAAKNTAYNYCRDKKKELDFDFEQEVIVDNYDSLEDDIIKRENLFCLDQVWNSLDSKTQYLLNGRFSAWYGDDGIHIATGDTSRYLRSAQVIGWADAAERIEELLDGGAFATNLEVTEAPRYPHWHGAGD